MRQETPKPHWVNCLAEAAVYKFVRNVTTIEGGSLLKGSRRTWKTFKNMTKKMTQALDASTQTP